MPTFKDTLAILITGDAKQFVTEVERAGNAAEKNLGKVDKAQGKTADTFIKSGAAMVGVAGVLAVGLGKSVTAANESQAAHVKLANSVKNSETATAGETARLEEQASALQRTTVATDEQVSAAQAMLVQFGLTEDQVKSLTPLVVDLARKQGIDYVAAAKAVGKSVEDSSSGLKRQGIIVDDVKYSTDKYGATVDALRQKVGGFANQEGKTFEGQLTRIKNQAGEFEESVGKGVVSVLEDVLPAANKAADGLGSVDKATGGMLGKLATVGTVTLGAVGTVSLLAGAVQKMKVAFQEGQALAGGFGTAVSGIAIAGGVVAGVIALAGALSLLGGESESAGDRVAAAARKSTKELVDGFEKQATAVEVQRSNLTATYGAVYANEKLAGTIRKRALDEFTAYAEKNIGTTKRLLTAYEQHPAALKKLGVTVDELRAIYEKESAAQRRSNKDAQDGQKVTDASRQSSGQRKQAEENLTKALDAQRKAEEARGKAVKDALDGTWSAVDAGRALRQSTAQLDDTMQHHAGDLELVQQNLEDVVKAAGEKAAQDQGPGATAAQKNDASMRTQLATMQLLKSKYPELGGVLDEWSGKLLQNIATTGQANSTDSASLSVLDGLKGKYKDLGPEIDALETKIRGKDAAQQGANASDHAAESVLNSLKEKYPELASDIDSLITKIHLIEGQHSATITITQRYEVQGKPITPLVLAPGSYNNDGTVNYDGDPTTGNSRYAGGGVRATSPGGRATITAHDDEFVLSADIVQAIRSGGTTRGKNAGRGAGFGGGDAPVIINNYYTLNLSAIDARGMRSLVLDALQEHVRAQGRGTLQKLVGVRTG